MKLLNLRAIALLSLLTLAGILAPREGAALRIVGGGGGEEAPPPPNQMGDPTGPGNGKGETAYFVFRAASSTTGRAEVVARFISRLGWCWHYASRRYTSRSSPGTWKP